MEPNLILGERVCLVTFHPATQVEKDTDESIDPLLAALAELEGWSILMSYPNADAGNQQIVGEIERFAQQRESSVYLTPSFGQTRYLSAMKNADLVIGNSSSGIIEAPSMGVPTINIGSRQDGRVASASVLHCSNSASAIRKAIQTALSEKHQMIVADKHNPYDKSGTAAKIAEILAATKFADLPIKRFLDLPELGGA